MNKLIFTKDALKNIKATGNVWGTTTEYVYNFTIRLPFGKTANFRQRSKNNLWGRFGGGWQFKLGIDIGGSSWIINLFVMSIRIDNKKESK